MISSIKHDSFHGHIRMPLFNIIGQQKCCLGLLFVFLVSFILLSPPVRASTNNSNPSVEFSDNGTLTLSAEALPLGTLLEKIREKTSVEFKIPKKLLEQPISISFQSLPLDKAIRRILRGVSYTCIFDSDGNVEKIITLPNASEDKDNSTARRAARLYLPHERTMESTPPPELEELMEAMKSMPSPEVENVDEAVQTTPEPTVEDIIKSIKAGEGAPPPELVELVEDMESMHSPEVGGIGEATRSAPHSEEENQ